MQLLFTLPQQETRKTLNQKIILRRAIAKWFLENDTPSAMAVDVATKSSTLKVDLAACWTQTRKITRNGHRVSLQEPVRTDVVIGCLTREDCWPECANAEDVLKEITELKKALKEQEAQIREQEPQLKESDVLFEEYAEWNYGKSKCKQYHQNRHRLTSLEMMLFRGTRLARIEASCCANRNYIAVPENTLAPEELVAGWGLFIVNFETETATLLKPPVHQEISLDMQLHLSQNMMIASTRQVTDMMGIKIADDTSVSLVRPPTIHHKL